METYHETALEKGVIDFDTSLIMITFIFIFNLFVMLIFKINLSFAYSFIFGRNIL